MKQLFPQFSEHIKKNKLIIDHDIIIAAFSGGKDSLALLLLLKELQHSINFQFIAAYFNHQLRKDAEEEEAWVRQCCQKLSVELIISRGDLKQHLLQNKSNLENTASIFRYQFFNRLLADYPHSKIATAHTQSDLTETFFIKLIRGSGLRGLSAIYQVKQQRFIRPLLQFSSSDILEFLNRNQIAHYQDYTNSDCSFLRNRLRRQILPAIREISPELDKHIFRTVQMIQEDYSYFSRVADQILKENLILEQILPLKILEKYHISIQRNILRSFIKKIKGNLLNIDYKHINDILVITNHPQSGISIPGIGLKIHKGYLIPDHFAISDYQYPLPGPGSYFIKEIKRTLIIKATTIYRQPKSNREIILPSDKIQFPLELRSPSKIDKYTKKDAQFSQKVFEMIRSSGFPKELRNFCPLLINADQSIIWVYGSPVAHPFKVQSLAQEDYLTISFA
jgi:tRNA(Ile)-lysidine synthase